MTNSIQNGDMQDCIEWWGGEKRSGREEGSQVWKVLISEIMGRDFNLDIKNPHIVASDLGVPETLLNDLTETEALVESLCAKLKATLTEALAQ